MIRKTFACGWRELRNMTAFAVKTSSVAQKDSHHSAVLMLTLLLIVHYASGSHAVNDLRTRPDPGDATYNATRITADQERHSPTNGVQGFHYGKKAPEMGCRELRSKRFISDGHCTTPRPISEVVCADWCIMPASPQAGLVPTYLQEADWRAYMRRQRISQRQGVNNNITDSYPILEKWRCVDGATKRRRVKLLCKDGARRVYHVRVVKKCKCTKKHDNIRNNRGEEGAGTGDEY